MKDQIEETESTVSKLTSHKKQTWHPPVLRCAEINYDTASGIGSNIDGFGGSTTFPE